MSDTLRWPEDESRASPVGARAAWRSVVNLTSPGVLDIEPADRSVDRGWFGDVILPVLVLLGSLAILATLYMLTRGLGGWLP